MDTVSGTIATNTMPTTHCMGFEQQEAGDPALRLALDYRDILQERARLDQRYADALDGIPEHLDFPRIYVDFTVRFYQGRQIKCFSKLEDIDDYIARHRSLSKAALAELKDIRQSLDQLIQDEAAFYEDSGVNAIRDQERENERQGSHIEKLIRRTTARSPLGVLVKVVLAERQAFADDNENTLSMEQIKRARNDLMHQFDDDWPFEGCCFESLEFYDKWLALVMAKIVRVAEAQGLLTPVNQGSAH